MKLARNELKNLMKKKLMQAGLQEAHAETAAEILPGPLNEATIRMVKFG